MEPIFIVGASVVGVVLVIALILSMYVKAPPDTAYIISGLRKEQKILIGRGGIKIPILKKGCRNPTGFRRRVKVAKSG